MAKKSAGEKVGRASPSAPPREPSKADGARGATRPTQRPSALVDTRVIYCGDNLEQLKKLADACVDLIYIDPPFNSNRNYEVFWGGERDKGFIVAFDYSDDALREIDRFFKADHAVIIPLTMKEILDEQIARKLA